MYKRIFIFVIIFVFIINLFSEDNKFFIELSYKKIATFNDAITLIRLLYNESDNNSTFIDNIIWAASKKLFRVTLPIKEDQINPIITRKEFSYWICGMLNITGNKNKETRLSRYQSYKLCVSLGIMGTGRGADDYFSGKELIDVFSYLDYYVRYKKITPREEEIERFKEDYQDFPEWRKILYKEFDEQREKEKKENKKIKDENKQQKYNNREFERKMKIDKKDKLEDHSSDTVNTIENVIEN